MCAQNWSRFGAGMAAETSQGRRRSARSKHDAILDAAVQAFGRDGYEDSKWADVAKAVGIGSTALYHCFESKLHCLYVSRPLPRRPRPPHTRADLGSTLIRARRSVKYHLTRPEVASI